MKEQILSVIREIKKDKSLGEDAHLVFDGILSSREIIQLIADMEEKFGVKIPVEEVLPDNFDTVEAISSMLARLKEQA